MFVTCIVVCHKSSGKEAGQVAQKKEVEHSSPGMGWSLEGEVSLGLGPLLPHHETQQESSPGRWGGDFSPGAELPLTHRDGEAGGQTPPLTVSVLLVEKFLKI